VQLRSATAGREEAFASSNPWASLGHHQPFVAGVDKSILDCSKREAWSLRLDVLPHVWHGNPLTARALLLMLNPGFGEQDLRDQTAPAFSDAVRSALALEPTALFWPLSPEDSSAAQWWRPRLAPLLAALGPEATISLALFSPTSNISLTTRRIGAPLRAFPRRSLHSPSSGEPWTTTLCSWSCVAGNVGSLLFLV